MNVPLRPISGRSRRRPLATERWLDSVLSDQPLMCCDSRGEPGWTCMEFDGTGLWCVACLEMDALLAFLLAPSQEQYIGSQVPPA